MEHAKRQEHQHAVAIDVVSLMGQSLGALQRMPLVRHRVVAETIFLDGEIAEGGQGISTGRVGLERLLELLPYRKMGVWAK